MEERPAATALIFCSPSNPTGCATPTQHMEALAAVLRDFSKVTVFSDEIYEQLVYISDDEGGGECGGCGGVCGPRLFRRPGWHV